MMLYIVNNSIHDCKHICASSMPSVPSKKTIIYNLLQNLNSHVLTDKSMTDPIFIKLDVIFVLWCQIINNSIITLRCVMNMFPMNMIRQWASDFNLRRMFCCCCKWCQIKLLCNALNVSTIFLLSEEVYTMTSQVVRKLYCVTGERPSLVMG